jgi:Xaa-Pro aminopeptidase
MKARLDKFRSLLSDNHLDAVLISSPANIVYYSGFSGFSSVERDGYVLVTPKNAYILTNALYAEAVKHTVSHLKLMEYTNQTPLTKLLDKITHKEGLNRVGFESDNLTVSEWKHLKSNFPKLLPVNLKNIRVIKTAQEIIDIEKAARIADAALEKTLSKIRPGMTEQELVFLLENEIRLTSSDIAFPTIVAFGKNAATPHHKSDTTVLKKNDLILIDFGAAYNEYRSDMTRTFFIGKTTKEQKKAYEAVLTAQQKAVEFLSSGLSNSLLHRGERVKASEVDNVARDFLVSRGYPSIPHSLGHGIGLEVHEAPRLSPSSKEFLTEGMVFSIEPGVYLPETLGIRIEDLYAIQNNTLIRLTHTPSAIMEL